MLKVLGLLALVSELDRVVGDVQLLNCRKGIGSGPVPRWSGRRLCWGPGAVSTTGGLFVEPGLTGG